jgi:hypothetical protein
MEKNDAGIGNWPVLLLILGLIGGATATQVSQRVTRPAQDVTAAIDATSAAAPAPSGAAELLTRLVGVSAATQPPDAPEPLRELLARARKAATGQRISIEFLVATLPDYVDSNSGWSFDSILDSVQRAAGAAGYVLDRFYLPDWAPTAADGTDQASGRQHETEPGLVMFRQVDEEKATTKMLAVFIVTETPTGGIHEAAFVAAARIVAAWHEAGDKAEDPVLRVLGPTFSGSSPSLRRGISTFLDNAPSWPASVRVLSGTATSEANRKLLKFQWSNPDDTGERRAVPVSFAATVRTDGDMLHALHDHLTEINPEWEHGKGIVLLVESNTGYGQGFVPQQGAEQAGAGGSGENGDNPFPKALQIPFPIHISRLRAEAERIRVAGPRAAGTGSGTMPSDMGPATDQLPSMTPQITAATIDTLVATILATIRREEYPAIGIFATDKRDHLFLAERIVREVPNALLFTTEADLIYVLPQFRSFIRGAIVASSYPLFNATQSLTSPHLAGRRRQQFSSMAAQGTYNAVLKLLGREDLLLDYLPPGCLRDDGKSFVLADSRVCLRPPVWISVAGRDGLWPIDRHVDEDDKRVDSYTEEIGSDQLRGQLAVSDSETYSRESAPLALRHVAKWMEAAFVLLLLALVVHMVAYLAEVDSTGLGRSEPSEFLSRWFPVKRLRAWMGHFTEQTRLLPGARLLDVSGIEKSLVTEHRLFLLIAFAILWFASVWTMRLFNIWLDDSPIELPRSVSHGHQPAAVNVWHFIYGGMLAILLMESLLAIRQRRAAVPRGWVGSAIVTCVALFLAFNAGLSLAGFLGSPHWANPVSATLLFARTVNPGNWASPAAPLLALLGVLYLWTLWNIRQLLMGGWSHRRESELFQLLTGREPRLSDEVADIMVSPWRRQDWRCLAIPFGLLLCFVLYVPMWYTPDGQQFGSFLWWCSLLIVFLVAHSLAMTVHLWLLISRILRHLCGHPIAAAFTRVAEEPFNWQLSLTPPRAIELKPMARKARTLQFELQQVVRDLVGVEASAVAGSSGEQRTVGANVLAPIPDVVIGSQAPAIEVASAAYEFAGSHEVVHVAESIVNTSALQSTRAERRRNNVCPRVPISGGATAGDFAEATTAEARALKVRHQDLDPVVTILGVELPDVLDGETREGGRHPYFNSLTWRTLVKLSDGLIPTLRHGFWHRGSVTGRPASEDWYRKAEALVGMQAAFVLRDLLARLVSGMTVTIAGAMLALTSHLFYSFPGRSAMLAFDWILVALAAATAAAMLIHLEKDPILARLWSKTSGRLVWTGGFIYRLGLYGAVPLITLFAWQFPEVGGMLFGWMEPLQKAIP